MRTIIYGPPGTGKTWTLIEEIKKFLENTDPKRIGYFTFSKNAAIHGKERAIENLDLFSDDLDYFQTLHSFCFNQLNLNKNQVMKEKHYKDLGEKMGLEIEGTQQDDDHDSVFYSKNPYIQLINLARSKDIDPIHYYHLTDNQKISLNKLEIINKELTRYKDQNGLIDFPDMVDRYLKGNPETGEQYIPPNFRVIFVDEAQDLSLMQWQLVKKIEDAATDSFIAGDDDQGIYKWNGAHVNTFINLEGKRKILDQSRRVPKAPFRLANKIIKKVKNRVEKEWLPKDEEGSVNRFSSLSDIDFSQGKWLILSNANYMLNAVGDILDEKNLYWQRRNATPRIKNVYEIIQKWDELRQGTPLHFNDCKKIFNKMNNNWDKKLQKNMVKDLFYDIDTLKETYGLKTEAEWHEALDELGTEEIRKIQKLIDSGEDLSKDPRIRVSTIHGVKGSERENVVVNTDLSGAAYEEYQKNPDDTHRLFYVAVTRTEKNLFLIEPQTRKAYEL